ncbi:MAG: hypothetical protein IKP95_09510 [Ruminococcus sp.]|nr:hypothetical protein [Ruminococcus sp.]
MNSIRFTPEAKKQIDEAYKKYISLDAVSKRKIRFSDYLSEFVGGSDVGQLTEVQKGIFAYALEKGDVERTFAYMVCNGRISLIADIEQLRLNTMMFEFPDNVSKMSLLDCSLKVKEYYTGKANPSVYGNRDDLIESYVNMYGGLITRYYLAEGNVENEELRRQKDGIAYVYFQKED